ncbi:hypothetical protein HUN01_00305 (plasmid) [Nostoc edaphicum CCNP1411]|uniref:CRISPR type III-associated protein domain-containing protein n=1 Tax=Nostoc edaphicum CCNP1411 TaxID=1472755 RepID=A0A7D7L9W7_9NOSO|nr:RAMP superfamily CRISPR-associated protein [Nostoc edaphicum]QMS86109.1 hypothetical protein HUN01_00305 [Nostoc edaphicum CCNP1411]
MSKNKPKKHSKKAAISNNKPVKNTVQPSKTQHKNLPPAPKIFSAHIKLISDWHIGCGAGITGDIDSLVQRNQDKLPYIPAKTLTGIWRDACELVALGLDNGSENGVWQKWVDYLFGEQPNIAVQAIETSPRSAALSIRAAYLPENLATLLKDKPQLREALTFVKPGIQINSKSGCAEEECLRFEEMVRGGTILEAKCEINLPEDENQKCTAYALLIAGTQLVERLGGKRRRGAGKCQLVVAEDIPSWINWLVDNPEAPTVPDLDKKYADINTEDIQITATENDNWLYIPLQIITKSPVIISQRTVGNITETLDYIPGTHLLRLVSRKLSNLGIHLRSAIARGDILVTNATLEVGEQQGRPIPLPLFYEKLGGGIEKGGKVYNRFLESEPNNQQLKGYRTGYIGSTNNSHLPQYAKINLTVGTHSTIEDKYQRPTSDVGGVYSYEAIQPGTQLKAELRLRKSWADLFKQKKANWWDCLNGKDRLGQSKKDDYGAVDIKVLGKPQDIHQNNSTNNSQLTVWLLSDILLRDERLRPSTSIGDLVKELETVLGVKLEIQKQEHDKLSLIARQHRIESWQVRWGLPRPSLVGLAAGTCVVFNVNGQLDASKLSQIEASGIGERRAEGYGQVCFNDPLLLRETSNLQQDNTENNKEPKNNSSQRLITLSDRAFTYARIVEKAAWREAIRRAVLQVAASPNNRLGIAPNQPTMSQLGALKSILGQLHKPENPREPGVVTQWLNNLEDTPNRKDKWSPQSLQTIRALISDENQIWNTLNLNFAEITLTSTGQQDLTARQWRNITNEQWQKSDQLWTEAVQALVDACIRAHKRDLEKDAYSTQTQGV